MRKSDLYLGDILESISRIERYTKNMSRGEFAKNNLVADAVVRNLEIIGEAVKKLPADLKTRHHNVEWKKVAGLRDILTHEYFGVDLDIVWDVVTNKVPQLKASIKEILKKT